MKSVNQSCYSPWSNLWSLVCFLKNHLLPNLFFSIAKKFPNFFSLECWATLNFFLTTPNVSSKSLESLWFMCPNPPVRSKQNNGAFTQIWGGTKCPLTRAESCSRRGRERCSTAGRPLGGAAKHLRLQQRDQWSRSTVKVLYYMSCSEEKCHIWLQYCYIFNHHVIIRHLFM